MTRSVRPPGPHINLVLAVIGQLFPSRFPFDPLAFGLDIAREYGDIAHYQVGPLHVYQLSHPDLSVLPPAGRNASRGTRFCRSGAARASALATASR